MKRKHRWTARIVAGLLCIGGLSGCKQQVFLEPADWQAAMNPNVPASLETNPHDPIVPSASETVMKPSTVLDPEGQTPRPLSLKEAIAISLEQGNLGSGAGNPGFVNDTLPSFTGRGSTATDTIKAFVFDPAIAMAEIERAEARFDARWLSSMTWGKQDQATLSLQQSFSNGDTAQFSTTLAKPLPTGGVAGITTSINYLNLSTPPLNPQFVALVTSYTPRVQFIFEQPLMRGFGVEVNQLATSHPGSVLIPGFSPSGGVGSEGILVTRIRAEQARAQFDSQINQMLLNVETAYWNLYSAYKNLIAQEEALKQSYAIYDFYLKRGDAEIGDPSLVPQSLAQYWTFRDAVIQARGEVLNAERNLRGILGMRSDDGTRLVPVDEPTTAPYSPDWNQVVTATRQNRPELIIARQELKARQLDIILQKNLRMPDVRLFTSYDINGLGGRLDGSNGALASLAGNTFNSWQLGIRADIPLGFRDANALVRQARLALYQAWHRLKDTERKADEFSVDAYRRLFQASVQIQTARSQRKALEEQVSILNTRIKVGQFAPEQYITLQQAQRDLASVTSNEFRAIASYNIALAQLEFAQGTIQRYNNVSVSEGPLPSFVQKKAADHFNARNASLKLREHPSSDIPLASPINYQPVLETLPNTLPTAPGTVIPGTMPSDPLQLLPPPKPLSPTPALPSGIEPAGAKKAQPQPIAPISSQPKIQKWDRWSPSSGSSSLPSGLPALPTPPQPLSGHQ